MRATKMRNLQAAHQRVRSRQVCSPLSKELRAKYGRRSVRVVEGDSVKVERGAYRNVDSKVTGVDVRSGTVTIDGLQGEKQRGDRFDIKIHASNLRVTGLNGGDKKRMKSITGVEKAITKETAPEPDDLAKDDLAKDDLAKDGPGESKDSEPGREDK